MWIVSESYLNFEITTKMSSIHTEKPLNVDTEICPLIDSINNDSKLNTPSNSDDSDLDQMVETIFAFYEVFLSDNTTLNNYQEANSKDENAGGDILSSTSSSEKVSSNSINSLINPQATNEGPPKIKKHRSKKPSSSSTSTAPGANEVITNITNISIQIDKERYAYLLTVPQLIGNAVNAADFKLLSETVNKAFIPQCKFRTSALSQDLIGRNYINELYTGVVRLIPDFIIKILPPDVNERILTSKAFSVGTRHATLQSDSSDYLFDHLKHNENEDESTSRKEARTVSKQLLEEKKPFAFQSKSLIHLVFNKEYTHFIMFVSVTKDDEIKETPIVITNKSKLLKEIS